MKTFILAALFALVGLPAFAQTYPDMIDLSMAVISNSPADIVSWPVTERIVTVSERPDGDPLAGLSFTFDPTLPVAWEFLTNPPATDNFQYTVWACAPVPIWSCSGFIQMWQGRSSTGAAIESDFHLNWAYDSRWGALNGYLPKAGDVMAFFVSAGNARGVPGVSSVRERSNVVTVTLPIEDTGDWSFPLAPQPPPIVTPPAPIVPPAPEPVPVPAPLPAPGPTPVPAPLPSQPVVTPTPVPAPIVITKTAPWWQTVIEGLLSIILGALGNKVL